MSTYFDKKKLLSDNSDLYISEYDKSLPTKYLGGIIEAKRDYQKASAEGNEALKQAANDKANSIRQSGGGYSGGSDGSEHNSVAKPYEIKINNKYNSPYSKNKEKILDMISEKGEFSYDPNEDPIYVMYEKLYKKLGDEAYDRALSDGALRTGGVVSTSAQSAAMQAKNRYNSMLTAKIPELYDSAYKKFQSEYERLYDELELYNTLDESEYQKYRDMITDWQTDRNYYYKKDEDEYNRLMKEYETESTLSLDNSKFEYDIEKDSKDEAYREKRDEVADEKWTKEFDYQSNRDLLEDERKDKEFDYTVQRDQVEDEQWLKEYNYQAARDSAAASRWYTQFYYEVERDKIEDEQWEKEFEYDAQRDAVEDEKWYAEFMYEVGRDGVEDEQWEKEFEYDVQRDTVEDEKWYAEFMYEVGRDGIEDAQWEKEFNQSTKNDTISQAIDIAKIVYGEPSVSFSNIESIIDKIE